MNIERLTQKAQEALAGAQAQAAKHNHQQIEPEHLLEALLEQTDALIPHLLEGMQIAPQGVRAKTEEHLGTIPQVSGDGSGQVYISQRMNRILGAAEEEAKRFKDDYTSVEHLLLAMLDDAGACGRILKEAGVTKDGLMKALQAIRGSQRVTSQNPEDTYQPLERYGTPIARV